MHQTKLVTLIINIIPLILFQCLPPIEKSLTHQLVTLQSAFCLANNGCRPNSNSSSPTTSTPQATTPQSPPSGLSYTLNNSVLIRTLTMANNSPTVTGIVTSYSISPALPTGITLNNTTGIISGTPTVVSGIVSYTITATNSLGSTTANISIEIRNGKRIFVTAINYKPGTAYTSSTSADSRCNTDTNRPVGPNLYKAMLVDTFRTASISPNAGDGQLDWVFRPNMPYERLDGTAVGNSNANSLLNFNLTLPIATAAITFHTGLNTNWTTNFASNCDNWTNGTNLTTGSGITGDGQNINTALLNDGANTSCGQSPSGQGLLCVEQ